jgi:hypothetical protein
MFAIAGEVLQSLGTCWPPANSSDCQGDRLAVAELAIDNRMVRLKKFDNKYDM